MSCNVNTPRVIKMGIDYGTVQLLSTGSIEAMYAQELAGKQIELDVLSFISHTPLVNNFVVQTIHDVATSQKCVLFTHALAVKIVANILNDVAVNWLIVCTDRDAMIAAEQAFPNCSVHYCSDDGNLGKAIVALNTQKYELVIFANNKLSPHYNMLLGTVGLYAEPIMIYQSSIKSIPLEKQYQGVIFFDEMSVDSFFVLNEMANNAVAFCINEDVANHLTKKLIKPTVVVQAPQPTVLSMIESVIVYYNR